MKVTDAALSREQAHHLADRCAAMLQERFGVRRVLLFGSAAGDAPWHSRSDLDLAVEGLRPEEYLSALNACYEILPAGLEVDLVPLESARPELRARLEGGRTMPDNATEALAVEIENELRNLERIVDSVARFLTHAPAEPDEVTVQGTAKYVHDFYEGVERIFERIAIRIDGDLPTGLAWHTLLLQRMGQPFSAARPAVIERDLEKRLAEYLRFRHLFRHTYGYDLEWARVRELCEPLADLLRVLKAQLGAFMALLREKDKEQSHSDDLRPGGLRSAD